MIRIVALCLILPTSIHALSNSLARSSISLTEPQTGCEVVLVGCFHGSQTSAADVREALSLSTNQEDDHAVVLELCASRCADLMKLSKGTDTTTATTSHPHNTPWVIRYGKNIQKTAKEQGFSSAAATAFLTGVSGLQSSKLEPGLEFKTALDIAKERKMDVVLADQSVDITVEKLGKLPKTAMEVLAGNEWLTLVKSLARASIGLSPHHLTLPLFLLRSKEAVGEALTFFLQPVVILLAFQLVFTAIEIPGLDMSHETNASPDSFLSQILNTILILSIYAAIALPATKIVVAERDDILTKGIETACHGRKRVVAVLGLLHVNGVADRLMDAGMQPSLRGGSDD